MTGWNEVDGDVVVVVNEPLELLNHAFFEAMADCAQRQDCGLAGPLVLGSDGKVITAGLLQSASAGLVDPLSGSSFASHGYMGLGKTIQVIAFLTAAFGKTGDARDWKRMRKMRHQKASWYPKVMIICPGTLISNWRRELDTVKVLHFFL